MDHHCSMQFLQSLFLPNSFLSDSAVKFQDFFLSSLICSKPFFKFHFLVRSLVVLLLYNLFLNLKMFSFTCMCVFF